MNVQDLATMQLAFKKQADIDTPASGAGAFGIEVLPSTGLAVAIAAIESAMIKRNRMKKRPRHGPRSATAAYETELSVGPADPIFEAVLGGTKTAALNFSNTDWGNATIAAAADPTMKTITFASGTIIVDGVSAGTFVKLGGSFAAGNKAKWIPVIEATATILTVPASYLPTSEGPIAAYTVAVAPFIATPAQYLDSAWSVEEQMTNPDILISKYGTGLRFNSLNFSVDPKAYVKLGFGLQGRDLTQLNSTSTPAYPAMTSPVFIESDSLILLDGGIYVNGKRRTDLTSFKLGISATASTTDVIGSNVSPDISLGQFGFTGDFTGVVGDGVDFASFSDEDDISVMFHCKEKNSEAFVGIYLGYASFGGYATPMGGEGLLVQSIPLFGGEDEQANHARTILLISTATS
jgi:hypothetical protein